MAESFINAGVQVTTVLTPIYTCPTGKTALVLMAQGANVDGATTGYITLSWKDVSNGNNVTNLVKELGIPAKSAVGLVEGKLVLESDDELMVAADANLLLELTVSIIEIG